MYCPTCFNNTLRLNSKGVLQVVINGKQMDAGRLLYNVDGRESDMLKDLQKKIEEFFRWYSNFKNKDPIQLIELMTSDMKCDNKCKIPAGLKIDVVDLLIDSTTIKRIMLDMSEKYQLKIQFKE